MSCKKIIYMLSIHVILSLIIVPQAFSKNVCADFFQMNTYKPSLSRRVDRFLTFVKSWSLGSASGTKNKYPIVENTWISESNFSRAFKEDYYMYVILREELNIINIPEFTAASMEIYDLANSKKSWLSYLKQLHTDAIKLAQNKNKQIDPLAKKLPRHLLLRVLMNRSKDRHEPKLLAITKTSAEEDFPKYVGQGPFLDVVLRRNDNHGMDTHLVQRDFYSKIVQKYFPENQNRFYELLAENILIWTYLFDAGSENGTDPGFLMKHFLQPIGFE